MSTLSDAYAYCLTALKEASRDHYLACLLMPEDVRQQMAALYLFDVETARIRDLVREPMPGEIRLQWWRDLIGSEADGTQGGPLAHALKDLIARQNLPQKPFIDLLDARIFDLYNDPMGGVEDFELYAGETASAVIQLGLLVCDKDNAAQNAEAAGHAGVALTVARLLRNFRACHSRGQVYIPAPMLAAAGLDAGVMQAPDIDLMKLSAGLELFASFGKGHLENARKAYKPAEKSLSPFLLTSLSDSVFALSKRRGAQILEGAEVERGPLARQWRLWRAAMARRF